jgi:hypothetical protein
MVAVNSQASVVSYALRYNALRDLQEAGVEQDDFEGEWLTAWKYLARAKTDHGASPSTDTFLGRFPDAELPSVRKSEMGMLVHNLKQARRYRVFLEALQESSGSLTSWEDVDDMIQRLQGKLNQLQGMSNKKAGLVDLFSDEVNDRLTKELRKRRSGQVIGIRTGFDRFDRIGGGLQKQKMITLMARTGVGKSWMSLAFLASAVMQERTFILYPLEMNLFEVATRLYTLMSSGLYGPQKAIKNFDLNNGHVNVRQVRKFMDSLKDLYGGRLLVADVGSLADQYTLERMEAEVELHKPDGFWVDYLTLVKPPPGARGETDGHEAVRRLAEGVAIIAKRRDVVGGCSAQVNRQAITSGVFLPRPEHISFGDAIGASSDMIVSANKQGSRLYYALVKNRGGPEFGKTRVNFDVNVGVLAEAADQDEEDD